MGIKDYIISTYKNPVSSLPDSPSQAGYTAAQLKAAFDANANDEIKTSINGIINTVDKQDNINAEEIQFLKDTKVDKIEGKGLSTNDYSNEDKAEVAKVKDKANTVDVLLKANEEEFIPTGDYNPATKKYVDDVEKVKADKDKVLYKDNTESYTPVGDYNPATKKYVDDIATDIRDKKADKDNVIQKDNTEVFVPENDYSPATKKYVDTEIDKVIAAAGAADMTKVVYDPQRKETDIFFYARNITDDTTGAVYKMGIDNGILYFDDGEEA
jgi:hypothetical protein